MWYFQILALIISVLPLAAKSQSVQDLIVENHYAYAPSSPGPFPALIAIPGCSGISTDDPEFEISSPDLQKDDLLFRRHYRAMATDLRDEGYAVYLIDVHRAEGVLTACAGEISSRTLAEYIDAAIIWVAEQPIVEKDQIHLIGWSMGGRGVLEWLHGPRKSAKKLRSAIAVYPGCDEASDLTIKLPTLMLLGGADDIADPRICENLVKAATAGDQVDLTIYPGARHGFDIEDAPQVIDIGGGMTVGYQPAASEASWSEILSFLHRND